MRTCKARDPDSRAWCVCVCFNGLRGRGTRTRHACGTRERHERGPTQRSSTEPAPARPVGPSCRGQGRGGCVAIPSRAHTQLLFWWTSAQARPLTTSGKGLWASPSGACDVITPEPIGRVSARTDFSADCWWSVTLGLLANNPKGPCLYLA